MLVHSSRLREQEISIESEMYTPCSLIYTVVKRTKQIEKSTQLQSFDWLHIGSPIEQNLTGDFWVSLMSGLRSSIAELTEPIEPVEQIKVIKMSVCTAVVEESRY